MCLCFLHCDNTLCDLHCWRQMSRMLKTGMSMCTVCWWDFDYSGQSVTRSQREKKKRKTVHFSNCHTSVSSLVSVCRCVFVFVWHTEQGECTHMHSCVRAHTHTKSACVLSQNQHEWQLLYNLNFCWVQCHVFRFKGPVCQHSDSNLDRNAHSLMFN